MAASQPGSGGAQPDEKGRKHNLGARTKQLIGAAAEWVAMTAPREVLPGRTYLITRRCTQRQYLLRPDPVARQIFEYCLAEAAGRHGMQLIAWVAMSNHYHAVVHDPDAKLPAFIQHLNKMLSKSGNAHRKRWENFFATEQTCVTYLPTASDVFDKVVYVLSNPMAAHLVDRLVHWPGSSSLSHLNGAETSHPRPKAFFAAKGRMPTTARLRAVKPPTSGTDESFESWSQRVRRAVEARERELDAARARDGTRVQGRKAVLRVSPFDSPTSATEHRNLRPAVACRNAEDRMVLLRRLRDFRKAYSVARRLYVAGNHEVVFPAGTYKFRSLGARCDPFTNAVTIDSLRARETVATPPS